MFIGQSAECFQEYFQNKITSLYSDNKNLSQKKYSYFVTHQRNYSSVKIQLTQLIIHTNNPQQSKLRFLPACIGYTLPDGTCLPCDSSCSTCSGYSTNCLSCQNGLYLILNRCLHCNSECATCLTAPENCITCPSSLFLSGSTCLDCSPACKSCSSFSICTSCRNGYYVNSSLSFTCSLCFNLCLSCSGPSSINCLSCYPGYYLSSNQCIRCQYRCKTCIDSVSCSSCFDNFKFSASNCLSCPALCKTCAIQTTDCTSCFPGYYLQGVLCKLCNSGCVTCTTAANVCQSCYSGYYLSGTNCNVCVGCTSCTSAALCTGCIYGYYQNGTSCIPCLSATLSCQTCSLTAFGVQCDTCFPRQVLNNLVIPQKCDPCPSNCLVCSLALGCSSCMSTFFVDVGGICSQCISNCKTCTDNLTCSTCITGYDLDATFQCVTCSSNCEICNSTACTQCQRGYYLSSGNCLACDSSCDKCSGTSTTCTQCYGSYTLASGSCSVTCAMPAASCNTNVGCYMSGPSCFYCDLTCLKCNLQSSPTNCTQCNTGHQLVSAQCSRITQNQCSGFTGANCSGCFYPFLLNSAKICILCDSAQYYNATCKDCPIGCNTCNSATVCTACDPANSNFYYTSSTVCAVCKFPCSTCTTNGGGCLTCAPGFLLSGGTCKTPYPALTVSPTNNSYMTSCDNRFYLSSNNCVNCASYCLLCTGVIACTSCMSGFFLNAGTCQRCSYNCMTCLNGTSCTTCSSTITRGITCSCLSGFFEAFAEECSPCISPCQTCSDDGNTCTSCVPSTFTSLIGSKCVCSAGYFYNIGICSKCHSSCKECFGVGPSDCLSCQLPLTLNRLYSSCQCPTGSYDPGSYTCITCPQQACTSCFSSLLCKSCQQNSILSLNTCSCIGGYTWNSLICKETFILPCSPILSQIAIYTCSICHYSCLTCYGFEYNNCLTCDSKRTYDSILQICNCNQGSYDSPAKKSCLLCHFSCQTCIGPLEFDCTKCDSTWNRQLDKTITNSDSHFQCICLNSFYNIKDVHTCGLCNSNCATCKGNKYYCLTCPPSIPLKLLKNNNVCYCPPLFYEDAISNTCKPCHYSCLNCIEKTTNDCVECLVGSIRYDNKLVPTDIKFQCPCLPFYYDDGTNAQCLPCHKSCKQCNGPSLNDCTDCGDITLTFRSLALISATSGSCNCIMSYRDDLPNNKCAPCPFNCFTCDPSSNCLSCMPTRGGTNCDCSPQYFETGISLCKKCTSLCGSCNLDPYICLTCNEGTDFRVLNFINNCACKDGYFDESTYDIITKLPLTEVPICTKCLNNCKTCLNNSPNQCLTCDKKKKFFLTNKGTCECVFGYQLNEENQETCQDQYYLSNKFMNNSQQKQYSDIFKWLLYALRALSWIHLLFNQPFSSWIGFRAHQLLLMQLYANSKVSAYVFSSLKLALDINPYSLFDFGKIFSPYDQEACLNGKIYFLQQSCRIMVNSQGLLISFSSVLIFYFILRATIFRQIVLFPSNPKLQLNWRQKLNTIKNEQIFPMLLIILQTEMMRLFFFALIDLFSTSKFSSNTLASIIVILLHTIFLLYAYFELFISKAIKSEMKLFYCFDIKPQSKYLFFFQSLLDYYSNLNFVVFGQDQNSQILTQLLCLVIFGLLLLIKQPFKLWWENISALVEIVSQALSYYFLLVATQQTFTITMSDEQLINFNSLSEKYYYSLCITIVATMVFMLIRMIKGIVRLYPIIHEIFTKHSIKGFKWHQLWEFQEGRLLEQKKSEIQFISTSEQYVNRSVLQEYLDRCDRPSEYLEIKPSKYLKYVQFHKQL